jgi:hypothetical protein
LCGEGLDPRKFSIDEFSTNVDYVKLWGLRKGHNGFKFKVDSNCPKLEARIKKLNDIIYQRGQANIAICLASAKGIVAKRKGAQVKWARFAEYTSKDQAHHVDSKRVLPPCAFTLVLQRV